MDWIVVGLGNPGKNYEYTRHNVGWLAIDAYAEKMGVKINRIKFRALCGECMVNGKKILLMKPQTYMNASGEAIAEACNYYDVAPDRVLVICDDVTLPFNRIRIRQKGSAGGHNGLKSIINCLGSDTFPRLRIGVSDRGDPTTDLADWVLGSFSGTEKKKLAERFADTNEIIPLMIDGRTEDAMSRYNGDKK
ncbi:MAG: aminoacyl-tRNA hydrolase [Clostridia bacterium]|nr:aminoacyl-tRNA hydrolase [Clostridia bacterium]MBQ2273645.1 aminoacyl-tRNA hydrolase [Clostridia bacterium]